jgi:rhamnose transport system ATP-binding protein
MDVVEAIGLRMSFGGQEVVKGVDLKLRAGEVHAIVGENGAGKSTVAKLIAGVYQPTGGVIHLNGNPVSLENPRQAIQLGIALIHQEPLTFPDLDVSENIFVGHQPVRNRLYGVDWPEMRRAAKRILDELGVAIDPKARVSDLSVADQQMVELACALSHNAQVLLMDETTASLTPKEVAELFAIVRKLKEQGVALAFVSHHLDEIWEIADRITVMRDGEKVAELIPSETTVDEVIQLMVGRSVNLSRKQHQRVVDAPPFLKVNKLSRIGQFRDISFEVRPGEIVGLAGLVGAGRTEVCRTLFGIDRPSSGTIEIGGTPVAIRRPTDAMSHGMAFVPEDRQHEGLLMPMSIEENASLAALRKLSKFGWVDRKEESKLALEFAQKLQTVFRSILQPVQELSGGNQQKIVLAKWLLTQPKLLILDEPTRGVDVGAKDEVHRLILQLVEQGLALLIVSSDLPELLALCDRVVVMREGSVIRELSREDATPESVMRAATGQDRTEGRIEAS